MATSFGLMQTTPKHLVTCIAPKRSMMLAPAPRKTNKKCKQTAEIINKKRPCRVIPSPNPITTLTLKVSKILTKSSPISCMDGKLFISSAPSSCPVKKSKNHQNRPQNEKNHQNLPKNLLNPKEHMIS